MDAFFSSWSAIALPQTQSHRKAYNMADSRSYIQIAIVNSVQLNIQQYTLEHTEVHGIIRNSQNVG